MSGLKWAGNGLLLFLLLLCWALALGWRGSIADDGGMTLYLGPDSVSYRELSLSERRAAVPVPFVLWRQDPGLTVKNTGLGRSHRADVVTLYGDSTLALPTLPMLLPGSGDGCLVDTDTAYALFGDHSPVGGSLTMDGTPYTIIGVFDWPDPMLVRQGRSDTEIGYNRITLGLPGSPNRTQDAEAFALRHGLSPAATLSAGFWSGWAGFFTRLPPLLLLAILLFASLRLALARRGTPVLALLLLCGTAVAAAFFWWITGLGFSIPVSLVPSRWSDFEFWAATLPELQGQLRAVLTLPKELPQAIPLYGMLWAGFWSAAALCFLVRVRRLSPKSPAALFRLAAFSAVAALPAAMVAGRLAPIDSAAVWLLLPLFFVWKYLVNR